MHSREGEAAAAAEPDAMSEAPVSVAETTAHEGAEAFAVADGGGKSTSTSPAAPASPSTVKERQIPVDPASLRRLGMVADQDSPLPAPSVLTAAVVQSPTLPPLRRPMFVGASLPCSAPAATSPAHGARRPGAGGGGGKWEERPAATHSPTSALRSLARQHSAALARLVAAPPPALSRSASRAEGRTMAPHDDDEEPPVEPKKKLAAEDGFTCGALCMLFSGFSRRKPFAGSTAAAATAVSSTSSMQRQQSGVRPRRSGASRVAASLELERFECGSWSPPPPPPPLPTAVAAQHDAAAVDCSHATEVAKTSCAGGEDAAKAPVKMAFVFDGEPEKPPAAAATRGILKNSASSRLESARPSTSSSQRHVRFSTAVAADVDVDVDAAAAACPSSPCITPRLARARAEFHAFLEAQSA